MATKKIFFAITVEWVVRFERNLYNDQQTDSQLYEVYLSGWLTLLLESLSALLHGGRTIDMWRRRGSTLAVVGRAVSLVLGGRGWWGLLRRPHGGRGLWRGHGRWLGRGTRRHPTTFSFQFDWFDIDLKVNLQQLK